MVIVAQYDYYFSGSASTDTVSVSKIVDTTFWQIIAITQYQN